MFVDLCHSKSDLPSLETYKPQISFFPRNRCRPHLHNPERPLKSLSGSFGRRWRRGCWPELPARLRLQGNPWYDASTIIYYQHANNSLPETKCIYPESEETPSLSDLKSTRFVGLLSPFWVVCSEFVMELLLCSFGWCGVTAMRDLYFGRKELTWLVVSY